MIFFLLKKLEVKLELNKFETLKTQLNESKVRGLKFISVKLRECNLIFSLI